MYYHGECPVYIKDTKQEINMRNRKTKIVAVEYVIGRNLDGDIICTHYLEENKNKNPKTMRK